MSKVLHCGEIVGGCTEVIRGETEEEIMDKGSVHAEQAHGFKDPPPEIIQQVKSLIRDE